MKHDTTDGYEIAIRLIAAETEAQSGFLDLGQLGLSRLPDELFELTHLKALNLGNWFSDGYERKQSEHQLRPNRFHKGWEKLSQLQLEALFLSSLELGEKELEFIQDTKLADSLTTLDCSGNQLTTLEPLASLSSLTTLDCSSNQLTKLEPLANLSSLTTLDCSFNQLMSLEPLIGLSFLTTLDCSYNQQTSLEPLACLGSLTKLNCSHNQLTTLVGLSHLTTLNCSHNQLITLEPLTGLSSLATLYCAYNNLTTLEPLACLSSLTALNCSDNQLTSLKPLAFLSSMTALYCRGNQLTTLEPLSGLSYLTTLNCSDNQLTTLEPLSGLSYLTTLYCSGNQLTTLEPLSGLSNLTKLECYNNPLIGNLSPLYGLKRIDEVNAFGCNVARLDLSWVRNAELQSLVIGPSGTAELPGEVLSPNFYTSCLDSLRSHIADLEDGSEPSSTAKLLVIGNGRVGKTQIARRLMGWPTESDPDSTHGVVVWQTQFPFDTRGGEAVPLNIWDFGGQDVYHGTHALFMRTHALFIVVWSLDAENAKEHEYDGIKFRNFRLPYWITYIEQLGGEHSPVIVVQNKCDTAEMEAKTPPIDDKLIENFSLYRPVHYSAHKDRGRATLDAAISDAIEQLHSQHKVARVGVGRLEVKKKLESMRSADAKITDPARRLHRTISQAQFEQICESASGSISSIPHFLSYLHNCGTVFYQPGLFDDQIILDQSWALEAIYSVLDRKNSLQQIRQNKGRFTRSLLDVLVWSDFQKKEQELFLSMMQSCGICFLVRNGDLGNEIEAEFLAPDLMPDRAAVEAEIQAIWNHDGPSSKTVFSYSFVHQALVRGLVSEIGQMATRNAEYWKYGICGYESKTASHLLIDYIAGKNGMAGKIVVETKGQRHEMLMRQLQEIVRRQNDKYGINDFEIEQNGEHANNQPIERDTEETAVKRLRFATSPALDTQNQYYVSYAWGDDSQEGKLRSQAVAELCDRANNAGVKILKDDEALEIGDRISKFMREIGRSEKVFVILSDRYLKSIYCMYELYEIWRNSKQDADSFLRKILLYRLDSAKIEHGEDRLDYAIYWKERYEKLREQIDRAGPEVLGERTLQELQMMHSFALTTDKVLSYIIDTVSANSIEDLARFEFPGRT